MRCHVAAEREMHEAVVRIKTEQRADHAQQAEAEGAGEIGLEHDRRRHRNPVAVRHPISALAGNGDRQTHAAAQCMPEGDRRQAQVRAQDGERIALDATCAAGAPSSALAAQFAAAAGEIGVAHGGAQLAAERMRACARAIVERAMRVRIGRRRASRRSQRRAAWPRRPSSACGGRQRTDAACRARCRSHRACARHIRAGAAGWT